MNIEVLATTIRNAMQAIRPPAKIISGILMACSLVKRPGLSVLVSLANVIKALEMRGMYMGDYADGSKNGTKEMAWAILNETYRALREDANVQVVMPAGSISFTGTGANAGGPVTVQGINVNYGTGNAQIQ